MTSTLYILLFKLFLFTSFALIKATEIPLCGVGIFELLDGSPGFPLGPSKRDHVAALPDEGRIVKINLFENDTGVYRAVRCSLRLETCPSCIMNVKYNPPAGFMPDKEIKMMPTCYESLVDPCFDLRFVEDRSDSAVDLIYQKSSIWEYPHRNELNSTGDSVILMLTMWNIDPNSTLSSYISDLFPITVTSLSNEEVIRGSPSDNILHNNISSIGFLESPRYPSAYPRSLEKRYVLINENSKGFVKLIFDDFHVHFQSELQILDSDGIEIVNTKREHRRPQAIISKGNQLTLEFKSHDFTQVVGFRARYEFVEEHDWSDRPNSRNCDEFLEGYGGEIKLEGHSHLLNTHVDCIWIIGRIPHMSRTFDRIFLKVEEFHLKGVNLRLEVREGPSSTSDRLLLLYDQQTADQLEHKQPRYGFTTSLSSPAYYVRLRGYLMNPNGLEIVYSQFYRWATALCPGVGEFHCGNARCIKATLRCDGINHCGDGSDEQCNRPNPDMVTNEADVSGLIALVIGVCGLIVLLISTTAVMARFYKRRLTVQRPGENMAGSPNYQTESAPTIQTVGERRFYVVPENRISVVEAPPSYDDALKHPAVLTSRSNSYANAAYVRSRDTTEAPSSTVSPAVSPPPPPLAEEEEDDVEVIVINENPEVTVTLESGRVLPEPEDKDQPSLPGSSRSAREDASWV